MELAQLYANADAELWKAQEMYSKNIMSYIDARQNWIQRQYAYEKAFAEEIERLQAKDMKVTIVKEIAKRNCLDEYKAMLEAETMKKKFSYFIKAGEAKINTIKKLLSIKTGNAG